MKQVTIYTDGSSLGNPGSGGWAAHLSYATTKKEIYGYQSDATNNQMELLAAIKALALLKNKCNVDLYTDSTYFRDGITKWIHNWLKNDWRSSTKKPVKNKELWQELYNLTKLHQINWHWVKAHNGNEHNERVDFLARNAAENKINI